MGGVVLGIPGPWANDFTEASDHYTTKIGGLPDWPIPAETLRPNLLECGVCANKLVLLAQVYAPVTTETFKIEERVIYVFGCILKKCGISPSSWRAIRMQKSGGGQEEVNSTGQNAGSSGESSLHESFKEDMLNGSDPDVALANGSSCSVREKHWWEDSDDEDLDLDDLKSALSEAATLASHLKKHNASHHSKTLGKCVSLDPTMPVAVVPCFYIYSQEEKNNSKDVASVLSSLSSVSIKEDQSNADDPADEKGWKEEYEYDKALGADRTYLKFKKRLDRNPEQCIRYSYGGEPLVATEELGDTGTCLLCGEPRHFELQLMSPMLYFLHEVANDRQKDALENWDWMTLLVCTCSKSCSQSCTEEYRSGDWIVAEEAVIVQSEETTGEAAARHYFS